MDNDIIETYGLLRARATTEADLERILAIERDPENIDFILCWTPEQHRAVLDDPHSAHWIFETVDDGRTVGFAILHGIDTPDRILHWRRLIITEKNQGFGHHAMRLVKKVAFERLGIHRLWFDVFVHNERGRHLYKSEGFVEEGVLRDCMFLNGTYRSQAIMSMLAREYKPT